MTRKILLRMIIVMSLGSIFLVLPSYLRALHTHVKTIKPTRHEERTWRKSWHRTWHAHDWHFQGKHWWNYKGWKNGYWWSWQPYTFEGKVWGLGYSHYPWYWHVDDVAISLSVNGLALYQLAEQKNWDTAIQIIENRIKELEKERDDLKYMQARSKMIRPLEQKIDRLERYLEDIEQYRHYN